MTTLKARVLPALPVSVVGLAPITASYASGILTIGMSGGSVAGNSGELQYNNNGALGAVAGSNWTGSNLTLPAPLTLSGGISGASPAPRITMGSYFDNAGNPSISHLDLFGGQYGFGISSGQLNYISNAVHAFYAGGVLTAATLLIGANSMLLSGGTVVANTPVFDASQTWNNAGVTFTAFKLNVTSTASGASSLLMDLQLGGNSKLKVGKDGNLVSAGILSGLQLQDRADDSNGWTWYVSTTILRGFSFGASADRITCDNNGVFTVTGSSAAFAVGDRFTGQTLLKGTDGHAWLKNNGSDRTILCANQGNNIFAAVAAGAGGAQVANGSYFGFGQSGNDAGGTSDTTLNREATGVVRVSSSINASPPADGWLQWGGQKRVTADFSKTSDTTLANITGLSVTLVAGRTYSFVAELPYTCAAAGGVKAAIAGTATATDIRYNGYIVDSAANGIKGNTQAAALATTVASAATTGTDGVIRIMGTITVNAAGTLTVQFAQNTSNGTASVVKRGAFFLVHDMP